MSHCIGDALNTIFGAKSSAKGVIDPWGAMISKRGCEVQPYSPYTPQPNCASWSIPYSLLSRSASFNSVDLYLAKMMKRMLLQIFIFGLVKLGPF